MALRDGERRTYRVSRMREAEVLDEPAARPSGFDLAGSWAQARRELEDESATAVEVTLRVAAHVLPRLRRPVPVHGQHRVPSTADGEVELTLPFDDEYWAVTSVLSLGDAAEVLAPTTVRDRVAAQLRAAAARYAAG